MNFTKHDNDKPRMELLPPRAIEEVAKVLTFGAEKYDDDNWRKVPNPRRYVSAALRHVFAYLRGETQDPESGLHHLAAAACSLLFIVDLELGAEPVAEEAPCRWEWLKANWGVRYIVPRGQEELHASYIGSLTSRGWSAYERPEDGAPFDEGDSGLIGLLDSLRKHDVITEAEHQHLLDTAPDA